MYNKARHTVEFLVQVNFLTVCHRHKSAICYVDLVKTVVFVSF